MTNSMSSRERMLTTLTRKGETDRVPYVELCVDNGVAQRIAGVDRWLTDLEFSTLLELDNINYWGAMPPLFVDRAAATNGREYHVGGLIKTKDDLAKMVFPDPHSDAFYEPAVQFVKAKGDLAACAVMYMGIDPTILSMGLQGFSYALYDDIELVHEILNKYASWASIVVERLCEIGFDIIWAADDIAGSSAPFFSPEVYRNVLLPHVKKVAKKITVPWLYHSDGNLLPVMDDLLSLGMNALHPIEPKAMDIFELKREYGSRVCLVGNIDLNTLTLGTPDDVRREVIEKIRRLAPGGGYLLSSSSSIASYCKPENVAAMVKAVKEFGRYPIIG